MTHDQKRDAIIQAAIKRFTHFTVAKTTMAEIASDLGISKALLYYYFPDKMNLYAAVLSEIIEKAQQKDASNLLKDEDPLRNVVFYLKKRRDFIMQYYNIVEFVKIAIERVPQDLKPLFEAAHASEFDSLQAILEKGKKQGQLKIKDLKSTAELFLYCLEGLRRVFLEKQGAGPFPGKEEFDQIFLKEKEFAAIFINGLKSTS